MATIYFTSTNATGDGTLYNAVQSAKSGDVVSPDPTVFGVGERVEIDFADILRVEEPITLDAAGTNLILTKTQVSGNIPSYVLIDAVYSVIMSFDARGITFKGRVLLGDNTSTFRFYNCRFGGFPKGYHSVHTVGYCTIEMYDCALTCGYASGFFGASTKGAYSFTRCTIAANKTNETSSARIAATYVDCVDEPDLATAGFANVPTSLADVDVTKLEEYDFAPLPSSPFATGGTTGAGATDLLGNKRGWTDASGSTQYAVGAFEVVKADYFLSKDAPSSVSFNEPSTWKTTRGGNAAPEVVGAGVFYVDESKTFTDAPPEGASVVVAGPSRVEIGDACVLDEIRAGARSTVAFKGAVRASSFDLRDESTVEIRQDDVVALDSLAYGAGVSLKSTGRAYLSAPGVDATSFNAENVVVGQRGANLSGFYADRKSSNALVFTWTPKSSSASIVIEQRVGDSWTTAATASGLTATIDGFDESFALNYDDWRAWDGDTFLTASPFYAKVDFFKYWSGVDATVSVNEWIVDPLVVKEWITDAITIKAGEMGYRNENALFLALIKNPLSGALLQPEEVEGITATFFKVGGWSSPNVWTPVDGWVDVAVPTDSVLPAPIDVSVLTQSGTTWSRDEGPNFSWTPNTTTSTPFADNGSYVVQVKIVLKDGKNPIVATFNNKVY